MEIKPKAKKQDEYTVNADIQIYAVSKIEAIQKVSNMLSLHKTAFWLGEVNKYDKES